MSKVVELKEKSSKFIGYAYPLNQVEEVESYLLESKNLHPKASHHCYAFRFGMNGEIYRANDDGEPSSTAGKPILGQLIKYDISDTLVIVVRYYGGINLGTSGLISAYKETANMALATAEFIIKYEYISFEILFTYDLMGSVMHFLKQLDIVIISKKLNEKPSVIIKVRKSLSNEKIIQFKALMLGITIDRVNQETHLPGCKFIELC
jgi:uncharacterized YigZ family protein